MRTYWGSAGWKQPPEMPIGEDLDLAIRSRYMFETVVLDHDELVRRTVDVAARTSLRDASDAFIASLSTRWLFLRPFLPSLVIARALPPHIFEPTVVTGGPPRRTGIGPCAVCNTWSKPQVTIDCNVLNFERHKWGGVRHLDLAFIWFCLDRLLDEGGQIPKDEDHELLGSIFASLRSAPSSASLTQSERLIRLPKSNKQERFALLETLSVIGVLEDPAHPGFLRGFPKTLDRQLPHRRNVERGYPGEWWRGAHGVNGSAVADLFPRLS